MENAENFTITRLLRAIEELCLENEIAQLLLQENWPPAQTLPAFVVLRQGCREHEEEFHSRMQILDTTTSSMPDVPPECSAFLLKLAIGIEKTRQASRERVERAKETL
jgi:hypothetical protein